MAVLVADVLQDLRQRLEAIADLAHRLAALRHHGEELKRGDQAVAGGREIRQHDMARLLAADIVAVLAHMLDHVAVADRRALQTETEVLQIALEPEIGHHRGDDAAAGEPPAPQPGLGDDRHQLIAVDHVALLVDDDHAVGVAVERDADIGAHLVDLADEIARARSSRNPC